jgi:endonuclease/exonuclease/phosphatase family metal-dependent hydrolase
MKREIRILSWNLHDLPWFLGPHHSRRLRHVTKRALELSPDIITFQEVWLRGDQQPMVQELTTAGYDVVESPSGHLGLKESGLLTCVATNSRWAIDTRWRERFAASAPAVTFWEGDGLSHKGMHILRLHHPEQGKMVLINTHLQSQYRNSYAEVRRQQLAQLTQLAETQAVDGIPLIVCGDFNTEPSESHVYSLLSDSPWIDLTTPFREACGSCKTYYKTRDEADAWIDYIIAWRDATLSIDMDLRLETNLYRDNPYSDHQGLYGVIAIDEASSSPPSLHPR